MKNLTSQISTQSKVSPPSKSISDQPSTYMTDHSSLCVFGSDFSANDYLTDYHVILLEENSTPLSYETYNSSSYHSSDPYKRTPMIINPAREILKLTRNERLKIFTEWQNSNKGLSHCNLKSPSLFERYLIVHNKYKDPQYGKFKSVKYSKNMQFIRRFNYEELIKIGAKYFRHNKDNYFCLTDNRGTSIVPVHGINPNDIILDVNSLKKPLKLNSHKPFTLGTPCYLKFREYEEYNIFNNFRTHMTNIRKYHYQHLMNCQLKDIKKIIHPFKSRMLKHFNDPRRLVTINYLMYLNKNKAEIILVNDPEPNQLKREDSYSQSSLIIHSLDSFNKSDSMSKIRDVILQQSSMTTYKGSMNTLLDTPYETGTSLKSN